MAYVCELSTGQTVYLENQGLQTRLVVSISSPGQQQQSSSSFQTGVWTEPPVAFDIGRGILLKIRTARGDAYIQVQGSSMSLTVGAPNTARFPKIPLQTKAFPNASPNFGTGSMPEMESMPGMEPMTPMEPMAPMEPMTMGNVSMDMNPMHMRLGNMAMSMGSSNGNGASHHSNGNGFERHGAERHGSDSYSQSTASSHVSVSASSHADSGHQPEQQRKFCNQCGGAVELSDRFCSACGNQLR